MGSEGGRRGSSKEEGHCHTALENLGFNPPLSLPGTALPVFS